MPLEPILTVADLNRFLETDFSEVHTDGKIFEVIATGPGSATMRLDPQEKHLRPGGTVSGPTLFALADVTAYITLLAHIGPVALAVTTNLNINFLRKPELGPLKCTCRILKLGKRLAVLDAAISELDDDEMVAHATATYSIPPK
jgi:uncharacterized protein (TIGR00369 family)